MDTDTRSTCVFDEQLDRLEEKLPSAPAAILRMNRAMADLTARQFDTITDRLGESGNVVLSTASQGLKTVAGTTRWVVEKTAGTALTGLRQITGQTRAQAKQTIEAVSDEITELADDATERLETAELHDLESMTKAELYEHAQELDIDGPASMTKAELISAIAAA